MWTVASDPLGPAGPVHRRRDGNIRELTAGQDRRDGAGFCRETGVIWEEEMLFGISPRPLERGLGSVLSWWLCVRLSRGVDRSWVTINE